MSETRYELYSINDEGTSRSVLVKNDHSTLKIKRVSDTAILPTRGSKKAAGIDLYADIHEPFVAIAPHQTKVIGSGIACEFPEGYWGALVPRSSIGIKRGLSLANNLGVLDEDYTAEILMAFYNHTDSPQIIERGERVAQIILLPYYLYDVVEVDEIRQTERGEGGIGSTGRK